MKVKELKDALAELPEDAEVRIDHPVAFMAIKMVAAMYPDENTTHVAISHEAIICDKVIWTDGD